MFCEKCKLDDKVFVFIAQNGFVHFKIKENIKQVLFLHNYIYLEFSGFPDYPGQ